MAVFAFLITATAVVILCLLWRRYWRWSIVVLCLLAAELYVSFRYRTVYGRYEMPAITARFEGLYLFEDPGRERTLGSIEGSTMWRVRLQVGQRYVNPGTHVRLLRVEGDSPVVSFLFGGTPVVSSAIVGGATFDTPPSPK